MKPDSLPQWKCHKVVRAAKITAADYAHHQIEVEWEPVPGGEKNSGILEPGAHFFSHHKPKVGGYFVAYDDGYASYSPAETFESGYARLT